MSTDTKNSADSRENVVSSQSVLVDSVGVKCRSDRSAADAENLTST